MNKAVRLMQRVASLDLIPAGGIIGAECFTEEVEATFSIVKGSSGSEFELALESEGKNLYIPFISENYQFYRYCLEFKEEKLKTNALHAVFGDIGIATDGTENVYIIDTNPAHGNGVVFNVPLKDLVDRVSHIITTATSEEGK